MTSLPSYQQATGRPDWLEIVAPYVSTRDYARLCRVSRSFHRQFAPRLWSDPIRAARLLGLHPNNDLDWYFHFVSRHAPNVRKETLELVTCLDFRGFAIGTSDFFSDPSERSIPETFRSFPSLFPGLRCILLDGHPELDPAPLAKPRDPIAVIGGDGMEPRPLFLSVAGCRAQLPSLFFETPYFRSLVYLDVSDIPGSLKTSLQASMRSGFLPNLRVLKARGREMDDSTGAFLCVTFAWRLWSLDLSRNNLTDKTVMTMISCCFPLSFMQSPSHYAVEGKLVTLYGVGSDAFGSTFRVIEESEWSGTFSHPNRYLVDAPGYYPHADRPPQETLHLRSDGRSTIRRDDADSMKSALAGGVGSPISDWHDVLALDICQRHDGITHLYLNENNITVDGVERLFWASGFHLHHFECDAPLFSPGPHALPGWLPASSSRIRGLLGLSHLFRPVVAANLRSLRVHHSLVTLTPTLEAEGLSVRACLWLAEERLRAATELAYPQAYVPDANPRLEWLALAGLPRYSSGPLIDKLIGFLRLAYEQEQAIAQVAATSRRSPSTLKGLRHIRLEFEPAPPDELGDLTEGVGLDAGALLASPADGEFSFFGGESWASTAAPEPAPSSPDTTFRCTSRIVSDTEATEPPSSSPPITRKPSTSTSTSAPTPTPAAPAREHLDNYPLPDTDPNDPERVLHATTWNGMPIVIPVWVGPGLRRPSHSPHTAVDAYMSHLSASPSTRAAPRPASPAQVAAGAPAGAVIFQAAWDAVFASASSAPFFDEAEGRGERPTAADLHGMRDVVAEVRAFRARTKAAYEASRRGEGNGGHGHGHGHWNGTLELVLKRSEDRYHSSDYWR